MVSFPFPLYYSEKNQYQQQTVNSFQNDTEKEASTKEQIYGTWLVVFLYTEIWPFIRTFCFSAFSQSFTETGNSLF